MFLNQLGNWQKMCGKIFAVILVFSLLPISIVTASGPGGNSLSPEVTQALRDVMREAASSSPEQRKTITRGVIRFLADTGHLTKSKVMPKPGAMGGCKPDDPKTGVWEKGMSSKQKMYLRAGLKAWLEANIFIDPISQALYTDIITSILIHELVHANQTGYNEIEALFAQIDFLLDLADSEPYASNPQDAQQLDEITDLLREIYLAEGGDEPLTWPPL